MKPPGIPVEAANDSLNVSFYRFVIDNLPIGVLTVSPEMKITTFNHWAEKLTGFSEEEVVGHPCEEIMQGGKCRRDCPLKTSLHRRKTLVRFENTIRSKAGETIPVRMNTAALQDSTGKLVGAVEAFQDISAIKAAQREKDNLISMFAHDMKSSLTIIGGFAIRLQKMSSAFSREKRDNYIEIIRKETEKLDFLVEDFLEFARLQTGKLKLNFQSTSLDKELLEMVEAYQPKAMQTGIRLELQNDTILPVIEADPRQLRRAFNNLLDNAFKFSDKGGTITITQEETADEVRVVISDQGKGIAEADLPYIFDLFRRGEGAGDKPGAGIGLASVKTIVEGHGGKVTAASELGNGSTFTVSLPKSTAKPSKKSRPLEIG